MSENSSADDDRDLNLGDGEEIDEEVKQKKRRERLEQNRISARESRKRKKNMIEELQRTVITLSREHKELSQRNDTLKQQLMELSQKYPNIVTNPHSNVVQQAAPQMNPMQTPQVPQQQVAQAPPPQQAEQPQAQAPMSSADAQSQQQQQMQQQPQQIQQQNPMVMSGINGFPQMFAPFMSQGSFPMMSQGQQQPGFAMPQFNPALMQQFMQPGMHMPGMTGTPSSSGQNGAGQNQMNFMGNAPLDANQQQAVMAQFSQAAQGGQQDKSQAQSAAV